MAFILKTDILKAIRSEDLEQITRGDDTVVDYGIDVAISEITSYISEHYNTALIFSQTGTSRHALLLNFGVDIAVYIIVSAVLPGQDLEDRRARYKRALDWLKELNKGNIVSDLPKSTPPEDSPNTRGAVGTHTKRNNYY